MSNGTAPRCSVCGENLHADGHSCSLYSSTISTPPGPVIPGHKIMHPLGRGGMGVVYLAEDLNLKRKVAVKLIARRKQEIKNAVERFTREARSMAAVEHPHIVRIYSFGEAEENNYIVMEYISGSSLSLEIRNNGALEEPRAFEILRQTTLALKAAANQGIVHRDIKPSNILLDESGQVHVSDFGLAKSISDQTESAITETGNVLGTPLYFSPEQAVGEGLDSRSDIYSLGIVFYEMLAGGPPFNGKRPLYLAQSIKPLFSDSTRISTAARSLIEWMTQHDPENRPGYEEILDSIDKAKPKTVKAEPRWKFVAAIFGFILLIAAGVSYQQKFFTPKESPNTTSQLQKRPSVAVFGFKNLSGADQVAWISGAISEMLRTELAVGEKLLILSGEEISRTAKELSIQQSDAFSITTLLNIRKNLPADYLVLGSYYVTPEQNQIRLDIHVQKTDNGQTAVRFTQTQTGLDLLGLVLAAGNRLRQALGITTLSQQQKETARASLSSNPEAVRFYSEGLARLRELDRRTARDLFMRAVVADSDFALAHSALSQTWLDLGYTKRAAETANTAMKLSKNLSREERLLVEGRYYQATNDWKSAIRTYETLFTFFPDNLEYGLLLLDVMNKAGKRTSAQQIVKQLRNSPSPMNEDPRIDLAESTTFEFYDARQHLKLAEAAAQKALIRGATLLQARALVSMATPLRSLNRRAEAISAYDRAKSIYKDHNIKEEVLIVEGHQSHLLMDSADLEKALTFEQTHLKTLIEMDELYNAALTQTSIGDFQYRLGRPEEAWKSYEAAVTMMEKIGNSNGMTYPISRQARIYRNRGNSAEAQRFYLKLIEIARSAGLDYSLPDYLITLADLYKQKGEPQKALAVYKEAAELNRELGNRSRAAELNVNIALLSKDKEDISSAKSTLNDLLRQYRQERIPNGELFVLEQFEEIYRSDKDIDNLIKTLRQRLEISRKLPEYAPLAMNLLDATHTFSEYGRLNEAEKYAREVAKFAVDLKQEMLRLESMIFIARILDERGQLREAKKLVDEISNQTRPQFWFRIWHLGMLARIHFQSDNPVEAEKLLQQALKMAEQGKSDSTKLYLLFRLAEIAIERANFDLAYALYQDADKISRKTLSENNAAYLQNSFAEFYFARGDYQKAEDEWRKVLEYTHKNSAPAEIYETQCSLAECRLRVNDIEGASKLLSGINDNSPDVKELFWTKTMIELARARLLGAQNKPEEGMKLLNSILQNAAAEGLQQLLLETNLLYAELELKAGKQSDAKLRLDGVQAQAQKLGFRLKAQQASSLLKRINFNTSKPK